MGSERVVEIEVLFCDVTAGLTICDGRLGWETGRFGVLGPDGIAAAVVAAFDAGGTADGAGAAALDALLVLLDGTLLFWGFVSSGVVMDADEICVGLERDKLLLVLLRTIGGTVNGVEVFCAVTVAVFEFAEDVTDVGAIDKFAAAVAPAENCTGEDNSFFFFFGGRPGSASLSLESLELESLELDDEESLELLLDEMLPPEGAMSCFAASSAFLAFFLAVPS